MSIEEASTFERLEGKIDEIRAFMLDLLTWKSELQEMLGEMQNSPFLSNIAKMFGSKR